jgi:hypothetical protein
MWPSLDGFLAVAKHRACLLIGSLATAVSVGFTVLVFSRHATIYRPYYYM